MRSLVALFGALVMALTVSLALASPAQAHRQKITISTVSHNERTGMLEVVHQVPIHDAEHALRQLGERTPDIIGKLESRRAFARYVAEQFSVVHGSEAIVLTLLGTQVEGGNLLVLQEAASPGRGAPLMVRSQILSAMFARQENRVNLGSGTSVDTLVFQNGDRAKRAVLP